MTKWKRDGSTIYTLIHAGWRKGEEQFKNQFAFSVYADAEVSAEEKEQAIAEIHAALSERDALRAQNAALVEALTELVADIQPPALAAEWQIRAPKSKILQKAKAAIAATEGGAE